MNLPTTASLPTAAGRPFVERIQRGGEALAALARSLGKLTGIDAARILDDLHTEARACLMRWRWKPARRGGPPP